ncbi:MAG: TRASH domain-containing protein [Candidatus Pacearchaeota archaeon]
MGLFSLFKEKEKVLQCDWCKKEIDAPSHTKVFGNTRYGFCSNSCKQNFRNWFKEMKSCGPSCACH